MIESHYCLVSVTLFTSEGRGFRPKIPGVLAMRLIKTASPPPEVTQKFGLIS